MSDRPFVVRAVSGLRKSIARYRSKRETIALVPTMGALHDGHLALIRAARRKARRVVVSVFVNPRQFAPNEDFKSYPRTFAADLKALRAQKVDLIWAPPPEIMYPEGFSTSVLPAGPALVRLEDGPRPHFFGGVATVVAKLFIQVGPDFAIFGQKDYQQLKVVTRMAKDLDLPLKVIGVPTVRERDGLAMSSRNVYLEPTERAAAPVLYRTLKECAAAIRAGKPLGSVLSAGRDAVAAAGFSLDYLEARHSETLEPIASLKDGPIRLLVAARIGRTRLIDNVAV